MLTRERLQEIRERAHFEHAQKIVGKHLRTCLDRDELLAAYDELQSEYAAAIRALRGFVWWMSDNGARIEAFVECGHEVREARTVLSTPRAKEVSE